MAKTDSQFEDLRQRLSGLLSDWETELAAVMRELEEQKSLAATQAAKVKSLENQDGELADLRQRVRDRDLALDYLKKKSKEKDLRLAELEKEHKRARAQAEELEQKLSELEKQAQEPKGGAQGELEAMRAELAARKSLVKSLRSDAERGKALEKELAANREIIAKMKRSVDRHVETIADLRRSSEAWEQKYWRLAETGNRDSSPDSDAFSERDYPDSHIEGMPPVDERLEVDGSRTIVIDMTEPLREARGERGRKNAKA